MSATRRTWRPVVDVSVSNESQHAALDPRCGDGIAPQDSSTRALALGEWVRRVLREARSQRPAQETEAKLKAVRKAAQYAFPTADIKQMLAEIERGYQS